VNPLCSELKLGTLGELLVQIRLLQFDVQSAPALKDTGNDLIAVRGGEFRAVQVKSSARGVCDCRGLELRSYHILAFVELRGDHRDLSLDQSIIYLLAREDVMKNSYHAADLGAFRFSQQRVDLLFGVGQRLTQSDLGRELG
jgi:hypothetical protein